jgi:signal transduction histidine kinase
MAGGIGIALENARLLDQIRGQAVELERSNRVKSEFLGIMSHELRTPLTVVLGYSEMMLDGMFGPVNSEQEQALREVLTRSKDLLTLINSILEVTRIEAEAVGADREVFHLGDFLMEEVKSAYTDPPDKKLLLRWEKPLEIPVRTDRQKLGQILRNLIDNAIKFTPQGSVTVSARLVPEGSPASDGRDLASPQTRWLAFDVKDTGIGISKEDLPSIFEMFHQVDSSDTRAQGGSGVGLFIVKRFSQLLGGTVEVESEPGRGSTFTVTLPID